MSEEEFDTCVIIIGFLPDEPSVETFVYKGVTFNFDHLSVEAGKELHAKCEEIQQLGDDMCELARKSLAEQGTVIESDADIRYLCSWVVTKPSSKNIQLTLPENTKYEYEGKHFKAKSRFIEDANPSERVAMFMERLLRKYFLMVHDYPLFVSVTINKPAEQSERTQTLICEQDREHTTSGYLCIVPEDDWNYLHETQRELIKILKKVKSFYH